MTTDLLTYDEVSLAEMLPQLELGISFSSGGSIYVELYDRHETDEDLKQIDLGDIILDHLGVEDERDLAFVTGLRDLYAVWKAAKAT